MAEEPDRKVDLCESCREIKPVAHVDPVGRSYCATCRLIMPQTTTEHMVTFLMETIPFEVGDRVEARTAGILFDGVGVIDQVSIEPENFGTPVYPSFHVVIDKKAYATAPDDLWYMESQLTKVS